MHTRGFFVNILLVLVKERQNGIAFLLYIRGPESTGSPTGLGGYLLPIPYRSVLRTIGSPCYFFLSGHPTKSREHQ